MDTKPTYTKFHNFVQGAVAYMVDHPDFAEAKMYVETRKSGNIWIAYETCDERTAVSGATRDKAVEAMLKQAAYVLRGLRAQAFWYAEDERLVQGSTAWHALYSGRENADDTVSEGNVTDDSPEYWELALSGYNSLMDMLAPEDRKLAEKHNLEDLPICSYNNHPTDDPQPLANGEVACPTCHPVASLTLAWDGLEESDAKNDAYRAADKNELDTMDHSPLLWFQVALARYQELTGTATSVAQDQPEVTVSVAVVDEVSQPLLEARQGLVNAAITVDAPEGVLVQVTEDEHQVVTVTISFATGVKLGHLWLRSDNAARKWAKEFGNGRKLVRVSSGGTHTPQAEEYRFIYVWR